MKRIELFEFEDYQWLPKSIRTGVTNLIAVMHKMMGTSEVISDLISRIKKEYNFNQIVDLGSGSGGPMLDVIEKINEKRKDDIKLILSDLHPTPKIIKQIQDKHLSNVHYHKKSIDATKINDAPKGLKTMIASFHHMPPPLAQKILKSAQSNKEPILIYEMGENKVPTILWWILLPISIVIMILMVIFLTPFVRPMTGKQLLFTFLIPIIPVVFAWDGQASSMRTYTFEDLKELIGDLETLDYKWEMGKGEKRNGKKVGYYLMGIPR